MDATRFDRIAKVFAERRLSRRGVLSQGGAGLAVAGLAAVRLPGAAAQDATPQAGVDTGATPAAGDAARRPMLLFLQSFQGGRIVAKEGEEGRYTVTLEQGLGQTIYFSDRPDRIVGTTPTEQFLDGLGFFDDNPPNAALVVETAPGETDIAVVELFNPVFDPSGPGVTYDIAVLKNWQNSLEMGFTEAPTDLAALAPAFGPAHLFIDDCADNYVTCSDNGPGPNAGIHRGRIPGKMGMCYSFPSGCQPCEPYGHNYNSQSDTRHYWGARCNEVIPECLQYNPEHGCYAWWP